MSKKENNGYSKHCLVKKINSVEIYLYKGWDLKHGKGFFAHSFTDDFKIGFGFHKTNKLTAVRLSLNIANVSQLSKIRFLKTLTCQFATNIKCMSGLGLEAAKLSHSNNLIKNTKHGKCSKTQIAYT